MPAPECPLCRSSSPRPFAEAHGRTYLLCSGCDLIFLRPDQRLGPAAERAHYALHENDPADPGYRAFLGRLTVPLVERLAPAAEGLDYGSGPGPTLSVMLEEQGFSMAIYDPFFAPDPAPLRRSYDFITCSETAEHFFHPREELERLVRLLRPGGWLGLMTERVPEDRPFEDWHYVRDPTHVCFYRTTTLRWLAERLDLQLELPAPSVALLRRRRLRE